MVSSGMLRRVALVTTDVSEERMLLVHRIYLCIYLYGKVQHTRSSVYV
jgi:hypothetical protein